MLEHRRGDEVTGAVAVSDVGLERLGRSHSTRSVTVPRRRGCGVELDRGWLKSQR